VAPADDGEEAVRRDVQERVERTSEPVPQHGVARAMPTDVANDQVRRRQYRRDEADEDGQGDERDDNHHDEDEERRADERPMRTKVPTSTARIVSAPTRPISEATSSNRSVAEYGSFGCNGC
jgi:hypothetical protein